MERFKSEEIQQDRVNHWDEKWSWRKGISESKVKTYYPALQLRNQRDRITDIMEDEESWMLKN